MYYDNVQLLYNQNPHSYLSMFEFFCEYFIDKADFHKIKHLEAFRVNFCYTAVLGSSKHAKSEFTV